MPARTLALFPTSQLLFCIRPLVQLCAARCRRAVAALVADLARTDTDRDGRGATHSADRGAGAEDPRRRIPGLPARHAGIRSMASDRLAARRSRRERLVYAATAIALDADSGRTRDAASRSAHHAATIIATSTGADRPGDAQTDETTRLAQRRADDAESAVTDASGRRRRVTQMAPRSAWWRTAAGGFRAAVRVPDFPC